MAMRNFDVQQSLERQIKDLFFNANFNGVATFTFNKGYGFDSISRNGVGDYRVYLEDKYVALRDFDIILVDSTARDFTIQIKGYDVNPSSGKAYIDFYTLSAGVKTELPLTILMGRVVVKNTTVI